jgi:hypothetical protein
MSSWGNKDDVASPGTVSLSGLTVTGSGTFFANNYSSGQVIEITGAGDAVINAITNATSMTIVSNTEISVGSISGAAYTVSEKPVYVIDTDTNIVADDVFGVSVAEQGVTTANTHHAGWVRIGDRYTDANGNIRQKSEVLVAMSTITSDADDDVQLPDA